MKSKSLTLGVLASEGLVMGLILERAMKARQGFKINNPSKIANPTGYQVSLLLVPTLQGYQLNPSLVVNGQTYTVYVKQETQFYLTVLDELGRPVENDGFNLIQPNTDGYNTILATFPQTNSKGIAEVGVTFPLVQTYSNLFALDSKFNKSVSFNLNCENYAIYP